MVSLLSVVTPLLAQGAPESSWLACDRRMRKTFEAIQAWRRLHNGNFPDRMTDLGNLNLLPPDSLVCPEVLRERHSASGATTGISSSADAADPPGAYEYEMSGKVEKWKGDRLFLPADAPHYTRQDLKAMLLRRALFEQVAILRCSSHRSSAPDQFAGEDEVWRNLTVEGTVYWSGRRWEQSWLDDVPYCARDANVIFGLKGPPFHTEKAPTLATALDLRSWSCAFGDHAWWWTYPYFEQGANRQPAAHLRPFFLEEHGRIVDLAGEQWWIDGLVQLQGRLMTNNESKFSAAAIQAFVWQKTGAAVGRAFHKAAWLQGTVWAAPPGETNGWLIWHYADGTTERTPIVYGRTIGRFWGEPSQLKGEKNFPEPAWSHHEDKETVGRDRWLRIYRQEWTNPRPEVTVTSLDFVSNRESRAAPFLIAVNVYP